MGFNNQHVYHIHGDSNPFTICWSNMVFLKIHHLVRGFSHWKNPPCLVDLPENHVWWPEGNILWFPKMLKWGILNHPIYYINLRYWLVVQSEEFPKSDWPQIDWLIIIFPMKVAIWRAYLSLRDIRMGVFHRFPKVWGTPTIDHLRKPSSGPLFGNRHRGTDGMGQTCRMPNMDDFRSWWSFNSWLHAQIWSIGTPFWPI